MIILNIKNIEKYFKSIKPYTDFIKYSNYSTKYEEITENTNVNFIFKIRISSDEKEKILFLKQARNYTKKSGQKFNPERIFYEFKALIKFEKILGKDIVPHVYFFDHDNYVMIMSDIKDGGELLDDIFNQGDLCIRVALRYGSTVGKLHSATYDLEETIRDVQAEREVKKFMLEIFKTAGARKFDEKAVNELLHDSSEVKTSILGVDFTSKNIFVIGNDIRFFDFEGVFRGDPAFDIGHALSDYFLRAENSPNLWNDVLIVINDFIKGYRRSFDIVNDDWKNLEKRAVKYLGMFMLHRSDGISKFRFLSESAKKKIRKHAVYFLRGKIDSFLSAYKLTSKN